MMQLPSPAPNPADPAVDMSAALRTLRLAQFSALVAVALCVSVPFSVYLQRWHIVAPIGRAFDGSNLLLIEP